MSENHFDIGVFGDEDEEDDALMTNGFEMSISSFWNISGVRGPFTSPTAEICRYPSVAILREGALRVDRKIIVGV